MSEIDDLLQQQLEALESGKPLTKVLQELPSGAEELVPLVRLASAVRQLTHPAPNLNGSTARQLATAVHQRRNHRPQTQPIFSLPWLRPAFATLAVIGAVLILLGAGIWMLGPRHAQAAVAMDLVGQVEVAANDSAASWQPLRAGDQVYAGQRLRTGEASNVTLVFFEGSRVTLGANADITLSRLEGSWNRSLRVVIDQHAGKTSHSVVPFRSADSQYQVLTPAGNASVHGTIFRVEVERTGQARFAVDAGKVLVASKNAQVMLDAGQATLIQSGQPVLLSGYQFELKGVVSNIAGTTWTVNGVSFQVTAETVLEGDPQLGSYVSVEGRVTAEGWIADKIEVTKPKDPKNEFTGILEDMEGDTWVVSGVALLITSETKLDDNLNVGDRVEVKFTVVGEQWIALNIDSLEEEPVETPEVTETITATETITPTATITPTVTITPTTTITPTVFVSCVGADPHPTGMKLAARYGVPYEEIMGWFCQRFGFGEIDLAYQLSAETGVPVAEIFAMKSSGMGWGNIKKELRKLQVTPSPPVTDTVTVEPKNKNKPFIPTPEPKPKNKNRGDSGSCLTSVNPTALVLAIRYGASYNQILRWYCSGMKWKQIEQRLIHTPKKPPKP